MREWEGRRERGGLEREREEKERDIREEKEREWGGMVEEGRSTSVNRNN